MRCWRESLTDTIEFCAAITRHMPHFEKEVEFDAAPFGITGLETELGLFIDLLVHKHRQNRYRRD